MRVLARALWLVAGLAPSSLLAQEAAGAEIPDEALPVIVVTAQKISQTQEQVPASLSLVSGETFRESGSTSFTDLQDYAANVAISLSGSAGTFGIRGLTTPDTNTAFDPSVGTVVDGVSYGRSNFLIGLFHDIDHVEVLRGPQGTLFGKNATAGLFNVTTNAPRPGFSAGADVLASSYGTVSVRPVLNQPIGESAALRLSGNYEFGDGARLDNTFLDRNEDNTRQATTRARLRLLPSDDLTIDVGAFHSRQDAHFNIFQFTQATPEMLAMARTYDPKTETRLDDHNSANYPSREKANLSSLSTTLQYQAPDFLQLIDPTIVSITGWAQAKTLNRDFDADFTAAPFLSDTLAKPSLYRQFTQELRIAAHAPDLFGWGHGVTFVTGLYFFDSRFDTSDIFAVEDLGAAFSYITAANAGSLARGLPPGTIGGLAGSLGAPLSTVLGLLDPLTSPILGPSQSASVKLDQDAQAYAYFGQFEHRFLPEWALIGGLRWGVERKDGRASSVAEGVLVPLIADQENHDTGLSRIEHDLSPKVGFKWIPSKDLNAYLTWAQGYKSGGFNALPLTPRNLEYDAERAEGIEAGTKFRGELFGTPLRASLALFSTTFDDLQVSTFRNGGFVILNAARARSRGFEAETFWMPLRGATVQASVGYAQARYLSYPDAPARADSGAQTQDLGGRPLAFAPRWTANLTPSMTLPLTDAFLTTFAISASYRDKRYLDLDDDPRKRQSAATVLDLRVILQGFDTPWSLMLVGHNLTDERISDQAISQPLAPGNFVATRTDYGRYASLLLSWSFGEE